MITQCPKCGAPVEFRYDDTFVRVCGSCQAAVQRTDRGVETFGDFADLLPLSTKLRLGAEGSYRGARFELVGVAQIRHAAGGLWHEWYARFVDGRWGWLAEAQGRFYLTFAKQLARTPPEPPEVGTRWALDGERAFTCAERGVATYVAAAGELPFPLHPRDEYAYADLDDGVDRFCTLDYGSPSRPEPAAAFVGPQVALAELGLSGGRDDAPAQAQGQGKRLACPQCDGSLELRTPDATMRIGCPYCGALIDCATPGSPAEVLVAGAGKGRRTQVLPLGRVGALDGVRWTVTAFLVRTAHVDGTDWPFEEYLLHSPELGFRWLVCSDGHWSLAQPVRVGAVENAGPEARYAGVAFRRFQEATLTVRHVVGEAYWPVEVGETVRSIDFVAPPAMLSVELGADELHWSLATYVERAAVEKAFGVKVGTATGVAPNQGPRAAGASRVFGVLLAAYLVAMIGTCLGAADRQVTQTSHVVDCAKKPVVVAEGEELPEQALEGRVQFSSPFSLVGGDNVTIELYAPVDNSWITIGGDLISEQTNTFVSFDQDVEYFHGVDGGESWTEGSQTQHVHLDAQPAGTYVLRLEAACGAASGRIRVDATVRQDTFRVLYWLVGLGLLMGPAVIFGIGWLLRERNRWRHSEFAPRHLRSSDSEDE